MANKIIAITDISNDHNQYIETLLFANILEKKYNNLCVIDLNTFDKSNDFFDIEDAKEKDGIYTFKLFDRCNYIIPSFEAVLGFKMNNLAKVMSNKNDILLINSCKIKTDFNKEFFEMATEIVVFADMRKNIVSDLMNFFLSYPMRKKNIKIFIYNFAGNIQDQKKYSSLLKQFSKVKIDTIEEIKKYNSIEKIRNIDPWVDIYKKINGAF